MFGGSLENASLSSTFIDAALNLSVSKAMEIRNYSIEALEHVISRAIVDMGIGGHTPASEIAHLFNPMTAVDLAKIIYATETLSWEIASDADISMEEARERFRAKNLAAIIDLNPYEERRLFKQLVELIESEIGKGIRANFG